MTIVELSAQNFQQFYQVFTELMQEGYGGFPPELREYFLANDYSSSNFMFWLEKNIRKILLVYADDISGAELQGFLVGDNTYGGIGFISWLGVRKQFRNQGVGKLLLAEYEKFARAKGAHLLELFTSSVNKGYYEKFGFKEIGRRKQGYYKQENIIMDKDLLLVGN